MRARPLLLLPALLLACDQPTEEDRRALITEVATEVADKIAADKVAELQTKHDALEQRVVKAEAYGQRIDDLEKRLAKLGDEVVSFESAVAETQMEVEELQKEVVKPVAPTAKPSKPDPEAYYKVVVGDARARGPADALVTIVTWSDFQCPYCNRVTPTIKELQADYGKDLRYVFKHNPLGFHPNARAAAIAAEAAGEQGKFFEMHEKLFDNQRDLSEKKFIQWAKELKLDVKRFKRDLESTALADKVDRQQKEGVALGARGTPSFFVNGRFLQGAQPAASFKTLIDEEMGKAKAKVAAGTSRASVYAETIAGGRTAP